MTSKKIIEGDLYFKLIDFPQFSEVPDSIAKKFKEQLKTMNRDSLSRNERWLSDMVECISEKDLLQKPFIQLKQDNGQILMLFLSGSDYKGIKDYNHHDLLVERKKVRIQVEVEEINCDTSSVYNVLKLLSAEKMDGQTFWKK